MDVRVEPTVLGAVFFANRCWVLLRCGVNCTQLVWRQPTALVFLLVDGREKFPVHGRKRKMERNWVDRSSIIKTRLGTLWVLLAISDGSAQSTLEKMGWPVKKEKARLQLIFVFLFQILL